jgi:hypothetical protein
MVGLVEDRMRYEYQYQYQYQFDVDAFNEEDERDAKYEMQTIKHKPPWDEEMRSALTSGRRSVAAAIAPR